jgi:acyl-CoA thioester hydrolase
MPCSSVSTVRVRYAETDKMGVVYYANYFVWFEVARTDLLRNMGWSYREMEQAGVSLPVIEAHCDAPPAGAVRRGAGREDGRTDAFTGAHGVRLPGRPPRAAGRAASGRTVHAALDRTGRPCRLPERVREVFA